MDITFNCVTCGQRIAIDEAGAGQFVGCPKCKEQVLVPKFYTSPSKPLDKPLPPAAVPVRETELPYPVTAEPANLQSCPDCRRQVSKRAVTCQHCGAPIAPVVAASPQPVVPPGKVVEKYKALRAISMLVQIAAGLALCVSVFALFAIIIIISMGGDGGMGMGGYWASTVVAGAIAGLILWAGAESIMVGIDIEENTRATRQLLERNQNRK